MPAFKNAGLFLAFNKKLPYILAMLRILILLLFFPLVTQAKIITTGQSEGMAFEVNQLVENLNIPWGFDFINDDEMLISEKKGRISLYNLKSKKLSHFPLLLEIHNKGQGGLLDIKKHPEYPKKPWIYISYAKPTPKGATTALARFQFKYSEKDRGYKISRLKEIFSAIAHSRKKVHFGSRIAFDEKGHLYLSVGERGVRKNGQDLKTHAGSILRLTEEGKPVKGNPLQAKKGLPEIWSYGHRNPQGLAYDFTNRRLWAIEHGPRGGDEINLVRKGHNFGWPKQSYGKEYWGPMAVGKHKIEGVTQPTHYYVPSIAPCGLEIYSGKAFPKWKGNLFSGALALTHLNRVVLDKDKFKKEERLLKDLTRRVRSVREGPKGFLYISTDNGEILQIRPKKKI